MSTDNKMITLPSLEQPDAWDAPILFDEFETPEISADLLPGILGGFAAALAHATETPEALSVMTILGVISAAITKKFVVSPKEGWEESVNIYTIIALPPANNKSQVLNSCIKPLVEWEKEQVLLMESTIKRLQSERKTQEKIIEVLRVKAGKSKSQLERDDFTHEITQKEINLIDVPVLPILFTNDATPESLTNLMHEQNGRLAIFSDEGGILETLAGLYSNGAANIDILLKGINGGDVRVKRKDRSYMLNPFLTIVLTVQNSIIQNMGEKRAYLGNGCLERFLYVLPKSKLGYRTHNTAPLSETITQDYHAKIKSLLDACACSGKDEQPRILTLSDGAMHLWKAFQADIEKQLRTDGRLSVCQGWAGKISGFALRIGALLHVAATGTSHPDIPDTIMRNAVEIATLLTTHALAAFNLIGIDQSIEDAKSVSQWIRSRGISSFTQSEIVLAMRNKKMSKPERLQKALMILHERNIVSAPVKLPTKKPTTLYYVNPQLKEKTDESFSTSEKVKKEKM
ncbi:hypothetical protein AQUSIP_20980 [Aquicella siphonis]|uniref:DUF3987 domain-containing protein n=1 Tax=Aquicella siphonis TaxID=254247 RepID=A0A5E4PKH5_9COXI|nr:YfjI family protein [Aquicella siphonis]VVC76772.1 hypothetical protein AQUSIP_20980 [Aquicella siphonis]